MKTRIIETIGVWATVLCLALTGCNMGDEPQNPTGAKGAVRVLVGTDAENAAQTASRTVVPANPGFAYTLTFSAEGQATVTAALDGNAGEVLLNTGVWTLTVIGKKDGEAVAESAPVSVIVSEEAATVTVLVHPLLNGAKGTFRYTITASEAVTDVSGTLTPREVGDATQSEIALTLGDEQTASVAPGYYRLTVRALKGTQPLVRQETVHIYSGAETSKSYALTEEDFAPVLYLGGTLSGDIAGYSPIAVAVFEDAECNILIDESGVTGGAWSLAVEDTRDTVYCKVRLEKDGETYYSKAVSLNGFPASGAADLVLPLEGYAVTFDAGGGAFEGGGATVTLTAPENGTLSLPSATQGEYRFVGWYNTDGRGTAETRINGDATFYAGWLIDAVASGGNDIESYLANAGGGHAPANPVFLKVSVDFTHGGWEFLFSALATVGKYVSLDLSHCVMEGTAFDPGTGAGADRVTALVLPTAAKSIRAGTWEDPTFQAFTALASISGAGVEMVGDYAFVNCDSLTEVSLPAAQTIGVEAFASCDSLKVVSLPTVQTIGVAAFAWCESLSAVSFPAATTIGNSAFFGCGYLTTVYLPAVTFIANGDGWYNDDGACYGAFSGCTSLEEVYLPAAQTIGDYAFYDCESLTIVNLPVAETIGIEAFLYCDSLESVSLPAADTIHNWAFSWCQSLTTVSLPASLTTVGSNPFVGCSALTTITVDPANTSFVAHDGMLLNKAETTLIAYPSATGAIALPAIVEVGDRAFWDCENLTTVSLPVAKNIGNYAFYECTSLTTVSLPVAKNIGNYAFYECTSLTTVSLPAAQTISNGAFAACWSLTTVSLPVAQTISNGAFWDCESLEAVSLPAAQTIGLDAFTWCYSLTTVSLPVAQTIGDRAFYYCRNLMTVSLPVAKNIGNYAFYECTSLTTMSLPATPPSLGGAIFYDTGYGSGTITISVPTGAVSAYTSAWGVSSYTSAGNSYSSVYGDYHKAISITGGAQ
jgi:hypothetical protein